MLGLAGEGRGLGGAHMSNHIRNWRVRRSPRRKASFWEIRNGKGVIGIVYSDETDARDMGNALKYKGSLKHMIAIAEQFEEQLRPSAKAKLNQARALIEASP